MTVPDVTALRDANGLYRGPIVDPHHHLWDLSLDRHPWLKRATESGGKSPLTRDHLPADYRTDAARQNVIATVHVEAGWDNADPSGEIIWLDGLEKPDGIAARYVAHAALAEPQIEALLEWYAAHERIVGVREILSWHPDPNKSFRSQRDLMEDPAWRRGLAKLPRHDLSFDLMISPWQMAEALRLAADFPDVAFILNHCGSPIDRDPDGMTRWRTGLYALAGAPNVSIKISDLVGYDPDWTLESLHEVVMICIDAFGTHRCAFASDHPVAALHASFDEVFEAFKVIVAGLNDEECARLFAKNAIRIYRLCTV